MPQISKRRTVSFVLAIVIYENFQSTFWALHDEHADLCDHIAPHDDMSFIAISGP